MKSWRSFEREFKSPALIISALGNDKSKIQYVGNKETLEAESSDEEPEVPDWLIFTIKSRKQKKKKKIVNLDIEGQSRKIN